MRSAAIVVLIPVFATLAWAATIPAEDALPVARQVDEAIDAALDFENLAVTSVVSSSISQATSSAASSAISRISSASAAVSRFMCNRQIFLDTVQRLIRLFFSRVTPSSHLASGTRAVAHSTSSAAAAHSTSSAARTGATSRASASASAAKASASATSSKKKSGAFHQVAWDGKVVALGFGAAIAAAAVI
ncbi:hypothetical protein IAU59_003377 [Kwoniella sp. CBS 9459]